MDYLISYPFQRTKFLTYGIAYIEFAKEYPHLFDALMESGFFTPDDRKGSVGTVGVCWKQRCFSQPSKPRTGLSYHPKIPKETMTIDQMIAETIVVTNYLRKRFGRE